MVLGEGFQEESASAPTVVHSEDGLDDVDDLQKLREIRMQQLRMEKQKASDVPDKRRDPSEGKYVQVQTEKAFFLEMRGHERVVCLLHDRKREEDPLHQALHDLAFKCVETRFCGLHEETAVEMMSRLPLEGLPTLIYFRAGQMVTMIPPSMILLAFQEAGLVACPETQRGTFKDALVKSLQHLLLPHGAIVSTMVEKKDDNDHDNPGSDEDDEDETSHHRSGKNTIQY
eukprot:gnl/MRDRNA2_/MRDRNA2_109057_c0_seq1.p1 gnl/MRDRNA2_/MRDRNA2_109057_c0~~gnl/MRDRNA2_/MRDRNA2_109057_c0_seq1.p1  ORF type:complete len:229 (+),score=64.22 gnl/MRDRNA2_/MRDRNA2_109057_c0_seq1:63-749(+)